MTKKLTALELIQQEMYYTTYDESCKDPTLTTQGDPRECRRPAGHAGPHASGFNDRLYLWGRT